MRPIKSDKVIQATPALRTRPLKQSCRCVPTDSPLKVSSGMVYLQLANKAEVNKIYKLRYLLSFSCTRWSSTLISKTSVLVLN